jgi:integrase
VSGLVDLARDGILCDRTTLADLDGMALDAMLQGAAERHAWNITTRHGTRAVLWRAKTHPDLDPHLCFQSHLHHVPRTFLGAHPVLWDYPWNLAHWLWRTVPDHADIVHLVNFAHDVARRRVLRLPPQRDAQRARDSAARRVLWFLRLVAVAHPPALWSWRTTILPTTIDRDGLINLAARTLGAYHVAGVVRPRRRARTTPTAQDPRRELLGFLRMAVADGVFEPGVPPGTRLDDNRLQAALLRLEDTDPARYRAGAPAVCLRDRPELTTADVDALHTVCHSKAERAFLTLVSTTGLRSCALAAARVADVWDDHRCEVRQRVHFLEKNSVVRTVTPNPEVRAALHAYLTAPDGHPGLAVSPYLFPGARRPGRPTASAARCLLARLCRRASGHLGGRRFSPHQFRHFIVNTLMQHGHRLEHVARFLGHRTPLTTYRHYWTDPDVGIQMHLVGGEEPVVEDKEGGGSATDAALYEALQAKIEECEALRRLLEVGSSD